MSYSEILKILAPCGLNCGKCQQFKAELEQAFPNIKIIIGTHEECVTHEEFRKRVKKLFCQPQKTMVDVILDKDEEG